MNDRAKRSPPAKRSEVVNNSAAGPRASLRKARFVVSRSYEDCVKNTEAVEKRPKFLFGMG
jgi:hypothetical protein